MIVSIGIRVQEEDGFCIESVLVTREGTNGSENYLISRVGMKSGSETLVVSTLAEVKARLLAIVEEVVV